MARMTISWHTRNIKAIRKIQTRFGMQQKMTVNYRTPIDIEQGSEDWELLKSLERDGWLTVLAIPMKDLL